MADGAPPPETARLFVAAIPPPAVLDVIEALSRPHERGVRYTTRDQWHVTLRFIGRAPVDAAVEGFQRVQASPVEAVLGPQVSRLGRNYVVVPVAGLDGLNEAVMDATRAVGEPPDHPRYTGHLTLARLRDRAACGIAGEPISARFTVREIHLVRSHQHPDGSRYEVIATHGLQTRT